MLWSAIYCALPCQRDVVSQELSGPLVSTLIGLAMSNVGIIPSTAPQYNTVNTLLLPLAVPLLLFSADIR